ncbi:MAG: DUF3486 family protein [Candidatus Krumholzibacteria bacterium]|nr:DUF3486 family protein [Candidatus Krumholzibacteria bacterium]
MPRRTHSTIDKLPAALRQTLTRMVVDALWPDDWLGARDGKPRYEDLVEYAACQGHSLSHSAVGRWAKGLLAIERMRANRQVVTAIMADLTDENAAAAQKAAAEMATALSLDFMLSHDDLTAKQLQDVARAIRDCGAIAIQADRHRRGQVEAKAKAADDAITVIARRKKIDPETLKLIREQVYGITTP